MLKKVKPGSGGGRRSGGHFVIVASRYNQRYVDAMLRAAERTLRAAGVESVEVVRVPGAFEIPVVVARRARRSVRRPAAVICLGVILRGETTHAQQVGEAVTGALMRISVAEEVPIIHEVLLLENTRQALARCVSRDHNRGTEAAQTALVMAEVMTRIG